MESMSFAPVGELSTELAANLCLLLANRGNVETVERAKVLSAEIGLSFDGCLATGRRLQKILAELDGKFSKPEESPAWTALKRRQAEFLAKSIQGNDGPHRQSRDCEMNANRIAALCGQWHQVSTSFIGRRLLSSGVV